MVIQKRGKNVAIAGAAAQSVFTAVLLILWLWTDSPALMSCVWLTGGGVAVWLMVALLFYVRQLARQEEQELQEIAARPAAGGALFQGERDVTLRPAAARQAWTERWVVPVFTLLWAAGHAAVGVFLLRRLAEAAASEVVNAAPATLFAVLVGFVGFLFSRYAMGMGRQPTWQALRAAGSYLLVNVLAIAAAAASLLAGVYGYGQVDRVVSLVLPCLQLVLAVELLLNFVLDLYRPRVPGQDRRPSFDSRLMNLAADPRRIGSSIAEALNYQFGFEVSKTWFYQLLSKAFVPLILFGAAVLLAMSSVVMVRQGETCVILRLGRLDGEARLLGPGLHLKWPWPIDTARTFDVGRMHEVVLGAGEERTENERRSDFIKGREVFTWTVEHGPRRELDFLIAVPRKEGQVAPDQSAESRVPPVHIIKLVISLQYRITDVMKYGYRYVDPEAVLRCEAYREMTRYCASATLTETAGEGGSDRPEAIMTFGRERAAEQLKSRIQKVVGPEGLDLGVEVVYVGFTSVHPPSEAAPSYEDVLTAERGVDQQRFQAEAEANRTLVEAAGDPAVAWELSLAIQGLEWLENLRNVRGDAAEFARTLKAYIGDAEERIRALDRQVEQEVLQGRFVREAQDSRSIPAVLRRQAADLLAELKAIEAEWAGTGRADLTDRIARARRRADEAFSRTSGTPKALVAQAEADRWRKELTERALAESFLRELSAYQASPRMYMLDRQMQVWEEVLPGMTKYVLGIDPAKVEHWMNWEQATESLPGVFETPAGGKEGKKD